MNNFLGDTERLADELFLIGHDDYNGRPLAAANLLDPALAGAILAELALAGRITITRGEVFVADNRAWQDPVADRALGEIVRHGDGYDARGWLEFIRPQVHEQVGLRLVSAGALRRESRRGLSLRMKVRWPGRDPNRVAAPRVRLAAVLERSDQPLDIRNATLAALVRSGGMIGVLGLPEHAVAQRISAARRLLPPALADLLNAVDATVAAATLSPRR
ncbi:GPP34 family phosphoprotein [Micromonospora sp. NPDC049523]|uniref:GOLPH3/VPS74 family protein n=1 Tax=Micromonospora sp. NPDC049523 TaxID=3155921 RepID=UPI003449001B